MASPYLFFHVEDQYTINDKICIRVLYSSQQLLLGDQYVPTFIGELDDIVTKYNIQKDGIIVFVDMKQVELKHVKLGKIKKIVKILTVKYPDFLHKCVVYNYTDLFKFLIDTIRLFLDERTSEKIVIKNNIDQVIQTLVSNQVTPASTMADSGIPDDSSDEEIVS